MQKVKVADLDLETNQELKRLFAGQIEGFSRFGESGYLIPRHYKNYLDEIKNMEVKTGDLWLLGYPRSGTTWTQSILWLINNNLDYETASKTLHNERWRYVEWYIYDHLIEKYKLFNEDLPHSLRIMKDVGADTLMSHRHLKSHLALSLLPPGLLDESKVVYIARDPRDVAVSQFHFCSMFKCHSYTGDFKTFWELFRKNQVPWSPHLAHVIEAWNVRHHPNMMFIFYEELITNLSGMIARISKFLGKNYTEMEIQKLCDYLDFNNFKKNETATASFFKLPEMVNPGCEPIVRKGKTKGWQDYFDKEMSEQAEKWMQEQLKNTDLRFPQ